MKPKPGQKNSVPHNPDVLACLLGDISMVRALGKCGIPVAVATSNHSDKATRSRYCTEIIEISGWSSDPAGTLSALTSWAEKQSARPVLFYQTDEDLLQISRFRSQLETYFRFVIPDPELVDDLVNKSRFYERAAACGIPIPKTKILCGGSPFIEQAEDWNSFPCILKPITRDEAWHRATCKDKKALHISSKQELQSILEQFHSESASLILQTVIAGGEENVLSYHAYVGEDQEIMVEFSGAKIRTSPRQYGFSTYLEITDDAEVHKLGREIVRKLRFHGVLKIDFKRDEHSRKLYVLEINPRFNLWHHPGTIAGSSIPDAVYRYCVDPGSVRIPAKPREGVRWMRPRCDLEAFHEYRSARQLSAIKWLYQAITVDVNEGLEFSDLGPVVHDILDIFRARNIAGSKASEDSCRSH